MRDGTKPDAEEGYQRKAVERELLELIDGRPIDMELLRGISGDRPMTPEEKRLVTELRSRRREHFYSDILFAISHEYFPPARAQVIWGEILRHKRDLASALGRNVGVAVAALDYFTNVRHLWKSTTLIRPRKIAAVAEIALLDGLTGLLSHSSFMAKLRQEVRRAQRYGDTFSCLLMDLDDFKRVNDTFGHPKGDDVLQRMGEVLQDTVRDTDIAARYGGEEFAVLLPRTSPQEGAALAARIRDSVEDAFASDVQVTVSIGVSNYPKDATDADGLVLTADEALYRTKRTGKNGVTIYPDTPG